MELIINECKYQDGMLVFAGLTNGKLFYGDIKLIPNSDDYELMFTDQFTAEEKDFTINKIKEMGAMQNVKNL